MLVAFPTRSNQPVPRAHALLPIWTEFLEVIFQRPPPLLLLRRAPSRQCLDTKVYGRTTPATHEMIIPPPPLPLVWTLSPRRVRPLLLSFFVGLGIRSKQAMKQVVVVVMMMMLMLMLMLYLFVFVALKSKAHHFFCVCGVILSCAPPRGGCYLTARR